MIDFEDIPKKPGCYLFKNKERKIIYIGKAKNLKKRVTSYFLKKDHDNKTAQLVKNIDSVEFIITDSEVEALLLENNLIKKHKPKYNIDLKDSKRYAFIEITAETYPRLITSRVKDSSKKQFGPFVSGQQREELRYLLVKLFKLRTCKRFPKKPCLRHKIGLCDAPCAMLITHKDYLEKIKVVERILQGKIKDLKKEIEEKMKIASKKKEFESAIVYRNQKFALDYLEDRQKVELNRKYDEDIINFLVHKDKAYIMLFKVFKGTLNNKQDFIVDLKEGFFEEFLSQYYLENDAPKNIILPLKASQVLKDVINLKNKHAVKFVLPKVGSKKQLLELVNKNIREIYFNKLDSLEELKTKLNMNSLAYTIECFDVSHLGGTLGVGSMVQFKNAVPNKSGYRRFRMKSYVGNDDFQGICELVRRRYSSLKRNREAFPDLILIDGGKGQLSGALKELEKLELNIPIISIAKKFEEIFVPGNEKPIIIDKKCKSLKLLQRIRDEAHRFAITYNRLLRDKKMKEEFREANNGF